MTATAIGRNSFKIIDLIPWREPDGVIVYVPQQEAGARTFCEGLLFIADHWCESLIVGAAIAGMVLLVSTPESGVNPRAQH